jgi:hypothetical protein
MTSQVETIYDEAAVKLRTSAGVPR